MKLKNIGTDFFKRARKQYILNRLKEIELPIKEMQPWAHKWNIPLIQKFNYFTPSTRQAYKKRVNSFHKCKRGVIFQSPLHSHP